MQHIKTMIIAAIIGWASWILPLDALDAGDGANPSAHMKVGSGDISESEMPPTQKVTSRPHSVSPPPTGPADRKPDQKSIAEESKSQTRKATTPVYPNRRWIMKQKDYKGQNIKPQKAKPLKWTSADQQQKCRAYQQSLAASFDKARFYSIQGDRCQTAQYGRNFLRTAKVSRQTCPDRFLEFNGFTPLVVRNMEQLEALGEESCLGKLRPASSDKKTKNGVAPGIKN